MGRRRTARDAVVKNRGGQPAYSHAHNCDGAQICHSGSAPRWQFFHVLRASTAECGAVHRGTRIAFNARMTTAEMIVWDTAVEQALRAVDAKLGRATCDASRAPLTELRFELALLVRGPNRGDVH